MLREVQPKRKRTQSKSPRRRTGGIGGFRFDSPPKEFKVLEASTKNEMNNLEMLNDMYGSKSLKFYKNRNINA
jgi:hypothetical protein